MLKEQKPFLVRDYDDGQDILITFEFHNREEIYVALANQDNAILLDDSVDYDIIYKFNRGYVTLHVSDGIAVSEETSVIVYRQTPQEQACSLVTGRTAPRPNLEMQLDRTVMMVQDMDFENRNALRLPVNDPAEPYLPLNEDRIDMMFGFEDTAIADIEAKPYPSGPIPVSAFMQMLLETETIEDYRMALQLWNISYESLANIQRVLDAVPNFETLPIFTPFILPV